jgi:hypothetical protein
MNTSDSQPSVLPPESEAVTFLKSLPLETQKALFVDWVARMKRGIMRGEGLASHALYIDMIAQENDCTIMDVLTLDGYPI